MKKIFVMMMALVMSLGMNAQIATENAKVLDNTFVTVNGGVATPLDFNSVFPLNASAGLAVGKMFTPVWGAEVEGTAWFGSHFFGDANSRFDWYGTGHNVVRGTYVGVNGLVNLTNLFAGYKGTPRTFEVSTVLGTGWAHTFAANVDDDASNDLAVKTGLDFAFNLGKTKAHTVSVRPAVLWNVTAKELPRTMGAQFDKRGAQLYLGVAYTYHFKTSNKTHHFKTYDVGAMMDEINMLKEDLAKKPKQVVVEKEVEKVVEKEVATDTNVTVYFTKGSAKLSDNAKAALDKLGQNAVVDVKGYADEVGPEKFNQTLSEKRAKTVADYLESRGLKVNTTTGYGETGDVVARVVVVSPAK